MSSIDTNNVTGIAAQHAMNDDRNRVDTNERAEAPRHVQQQGSFSVSESDEDLDFAANSSAESEHAESDHPGEAAGSKKKQKNGEGSLGCSRLLVALLAAGGLFGLCVMILFQSANEDGSTSAKKNADEDSADLMDATSTEIKATDGSGTKAAKGSGGPEDNVGIIKRNFNGEKDLFRPADDFVYVQMNIKNFPIYSIIGKYATKYYRVGKFVVSENCEKLYECPGDSGPCPSPNKVTEHLEKIWPDVRAAMKKKTLEDRQDVYARIEECDLDAYLKKREEKYFNLGEFLVSENAKFLSEEEDCETPIDIKYGEVLERTKPNWWGNVKFRNVELTRVSSETFVVRLRIAMDRVLKRQEEKERKAEEEEQKWRDFKYDFKEGMTICVLIVCIVVIVVGVFAVFFDVAFNNYNSLCGCYGDEIEEYIDKDDEVDNVGDLGCNWTSAKEIVWATFFAVVWSVVFFFCCYCCLEYQKK